MKTVKCKLISKLVFFVDNLTRQFICWLADCCCVLTQVLTKVKNKVSLIWCDIYSLWYAFHMRVSEKCDTTLFQTCKLIHPPSGQIPVDCRACSQFRITIQPNVHVFALFCTARLQQATGFEPRTFLLWGDWGDHLNFKTDWLKLSSSTLLMRCIALASPPFMAEVFILENCLWSGSGIKRLPTDLTN